MSEKTETNPHQSSPSPAGAARSASWLALLVIILAQIQMGINVNALPISIGPIVEEFDTTPTAVGTALVVYSLVVAGFVMLGAKLGKIIGSRLVFQGSVLLHGIAMAMIAVSVREDTMINAQILAGMAAALLVPTLVVMITGSYHGKQQAQALGILAGTPAISAIIAFLIAGFLATFFSWRYTFGLLFFLSLVVFILSFKLHSVPRIKGLQIDFIGAVLAAASIIFISLGFNNLNTWGLVLASPGAPIGILGISPAPLMILVGLFLGQAFFGWTNMRVETKKTPLVDLRVIDSSQERSAIISLLIICALGPAVNFLLPLYMQIIEGYSSMQTAVLLMPYTLSIFISAVFVVRLYDRWAPRQIGFFSFLITTAGLLVLAITLHNDWSTPGVILGMIIVGVGEGALLTLLFNILVTSSPKELSGDVGATRGVANNLGTALGTSFASVVAVGLLGVFVSTAFNASPGIPAQLQAQIPLAQVNFITTAHLKEFLLENTSATPQQVEAVVEINEAARLRALKAAFLILAGLGLLAIFPSRGLPNYLPSEIPVEGEPLEDPAEVKSR